MSGVFIDKIFDGLPYSVNRAYKTRYKTGAIYMDPACEAWKERITGLFRFEATQEMRQSPLFTVRVLLLMDYLRFQKGVGYLVKHGVVDTSNVVKILEDALEAAFQINDKRNRRIVVECLHKPDLKEGLTRVTVARLPIERVLDWERFYEGLN